MNKRRMHGFTLAEMAVVVVIMVIVLGSSLKLLNSQTHNAAIQQTRDKQAELRWELVNFLRTNGRLPCPDAVAAPPDGIEDAPCNGSLAAAQGVLPWRTLNVARGQVVDGWGNFFTYAVANGVAPTTTDWTSSSNFNLGANTFTIREYAPAAPVPNLRIQERDNGGAAVDASTTAVAVLVSHGKSSWGAMKQSGSREPNGGGIDETTNGTPDGLFVVRPETIGAGAAVGGVFDDIVVFLNPNHLFAPLISDKTLLGGCMAYCATPGAGCSYTAVPLGLNTGTCP